LNEIAHRQRHRRPWWKRRRFWIAVIAVILAIALAWWLLSLAESLPHERD